MLEDKIRKRLKIQGILKIEGKVIKIKKSIGRLQGTRDGLLFKFVLLIGF